MTITPINKSNYNLNTKKQPAFKAKVNATFSALESLDKSLSKKYEVMSLNTRIKHFGLGTLNFEKTFIRYKNVIEKVTTKAGFHGTITLVKEEGSPFLKLLYQPLRKTYGGHKKPDNVYISPSDILPNWLNFSNPMKDAKQDILEKLTSITTES